VRTLGSSPVVQFLQRALDQLGGELAAAEGRPGRLDARTAELAASLPAAIEEVATTQFERLVSETLSLPVDVEGLYQEPHVGGSPERCGVRRRPDPRTRNGRAGGGAGPDRPRRLSA
jgi:hypothetical protein